VIYHKLRTTPQIGLVFFLFKISNRVQTTNDVLRVLLKQLLEQCDEIPESVYSAFSSQSGAPDNDTLTRLFAMCLSAFSSMYSKPVFILLDAFDEFKNEKDERYQRKEFLLAISKFLNSGNVKVLVTTRPQNQGQLLTSFTGAVVKEVQTNRRDVEEYLDRQMVDLDLPPRLRDAIKEKITAQAGELMYVYPGLNLSDIE
jgi:hypothetical protein